MNCTAKCVICGADLPADMTQLLLDLKGNSACLRHEGSKELFKWIIKHQQAELDHYKREAEKIPSVCRWWQDILSDIPDGEPCTRMLMDMCLQICPKYRKEAEK